jgi:hypothetical protein
MRPISAIITFTLAERRCRRHGIKIHFMRHARSAQGFAKRVPRKPKKLFQKNGGRFSQG